VSSDRFPTFVRLHIKGKILRVCLKCGLGFGTSLRWVEEEKIVILRCVIPVVCRKTNGEVNISHENTGMVVWIYDGI